MIREFHKKFKYFAKQRKDAFDARFSVRSREAAKIGLPTEEFFIKFELWEILL